MAAATERLRKMVRSPWSFFARLTGRQTTAPEVPTEADKYSPTDTLASIPLSPDPTSEPESIPERHRYPADQTVPSDADRRDAQDLDQVVTGPADTDRSWSTADEEDRPDDPRRSVKSSGYKSKRRSRSERPTASPRRPLPIQVRR